MVHAYDPKKYKTPTGTKLSCKGWIQEAALRMLLNNLNSDVAERHGKLVSILKILKTLQEFYSFK